MSTSEQNVHISLDVTLNTEDNIPTLRNFTVKITDDKKSTNRKSVSQDKKRSKSASVCEQNWTFDTGHKTEQMDGTNQIVMIDDLIPPPDEILDDVNNNDSKNDNSGFNTFPTQAASISSKDKLSGGGSKPISKKQKDLINKMADEQNKNVNDVVDRLCHKSIDDLKGHEADKVIKSMSKQRR